MVPIARRMVARDGIRFLVSVAGAGFSALLMLFLLGVYEGVQTEANGYVRSRPADVWVAQDNTTNLIRSTSMVSGTVGADLLGLEGVARIAPLLRTIVTAEVGGRAVTFFIFGIDPATPLTAPSVMAGRDRPGPGELILDRALAARHRLRVGDRLQVQKRTFRVAGISTGTNAVITQFAFATLDDAADLLGLPGVVSFWLLTAQEGVTPDRLAAAVRAGMPGLNAFSHEQFVQNNLDEMRTGLLPILATIAALGLLTGGAVVTLLLYGGVLDRRADYAVLKALGASQLFLALLVARQSLLAIAAGLAFGALGYAAAVPLLHWLVPEAALRMTPTIALTVAILTLGMGLAGAWLAIRKLRWIHPGEVFRA